MDDYARSYGHDPAGSWILIVHEDGSSDFFPVTDVRAYGLSFLELHTTEVADGVQEILRAAGYRHVPSLAWAKGGGTASGFEEIESLYLEHLQATEAGLKELTGLKSLSSLYLVGPQVTDAVLKRLRAAGLLPTPAPARLAEVESREPNGTPARDAALAELGALKGLSILNLSGKPVTDAGLKELAGLESLFSLNLSYTKITDAGLKELAALKGLYHLNLHNTRVTDAGLKELAALPGLASLNLSHTDVTDSGLRELTALKSLAILSLSSVQLTDGALQTLRAAGLLHSLSPARAKDGGRPSCPAEVTSLDLTDTPVTDLGLKELWDLAALRTLELRGTRVTAAGIADFQEALPNCRIER